MPTLKLSAGIENLRSFVRFVSDCAQSRGFSEKRTREIEIAVEEALVNIFHYAYPQRQGDVTITCKMGENQTLVIEIEDTGIFFDLTSIPEPDLCSDVQHRKIGGLGIFLIRKMVNELHYRRESGRNILIMIIYPELHAAMPFKNQAGARLRHKEIKAPENANE